MFCESCGKKISDTAKFCRYCGAKVRDPETGEKSEWENPWNTEIIEPGEQKAEPGRNIFAEDTEPSADN